MKVLVTGATGFVGGAVARRLLADGDEVHALVRDEAAAAPLREAGAKLFGKEQRPVQAGAPPPAGGSTHEPGGEGNPGDVLRIAGFERESKARFEMRQRLHRLRFLRPGVHVTAPGRLRSPERNARTIRTGAPRKFIMRMDGAAEPLPEPAESAVRCGGFFIVWLDERPSVRLIPGDRLLAPDVPRAVSAALEEAAQLLFQTV